MRVGPILKLWRESKGLTVREAAKLIGLGAMTYNRIERGKSCNADAAAAIIVWLIRG